MCAGNGFNRLIPFDRGLRTLIEHPVLVADDANLQNRVRREMNQREKLVRDDLILNIKRPDDRFRAVLGSMTSSDIAIDCGANVGGVTQEIAATGCSVHSFEPDPVAAAKLREVGRRYENVTIHPAAVGTESGRQLLYFHPKRMDGRGPIEMTQSSSLLADKGNVQTSSHVEVDVIDLPAFIAGLNKPVKLLKVDIEGGEADLLRRLIDEKLYEDIGYAFFETHETKIPSTVVTMQGVRSDLKRLGIRHFFLDWK